MTVQRYVFGYGSLVNRATHGHSPVFEANVTGWQRLWGIRFIERGLTSLTITPAPGATTHGIIARVDDSDWESLNARETGYTRHLLRADEITHSGPDAAEVYVYAAPRPEPATREFPILASYLDVVLQGFAALGGARAQAQFVETTTGWGDSILDDRAAPIYPRAQPITPAQRSAHDALLPPLTRVPASRP